MEKTLGAMANAAKLLRESLDSNSRYENAINDDEKYMVCGLNKEQYKRIQGIVPVFFYCIYNFFVVK